MELQPVQHTPVLRPCSSARGVARALGILGPWTWPALRFPRSGSVFRLPCKAIVCQLLLFVLFPPLLFRVGGFLVRYSRNSFWLPFVMPQKTAQGAAKRQTHTLRMKQPACHGLADCISSKITSCPWDVSQPYWGGGLKISQNSGSPFGSFWLASKGTHHFGGAQFIQYPANWGKPAVFSYAYMCIYYHDHHYHMNIYIYIYSFICMYIRVFAWSTSCT